MHTDCRKLDGCRRCKVQALRLTQRDGIAHKQTPGRAHNILIHGRAIPLPGPKQMPHRINGLAAPQGRLRRMGRPARGSTSDAVP